jgi:Spy/CpxP family protein refolding chaperone
MTRHSKLRIAFIVIAVAALAAAVPLAAQGPGSGPGQGPGPAAGFGPGPGFGAGPGGACAGAGLGAGPGQQRAYGHHGGPGHRFGRLARYLELTDEQLAAAQAIFEAAREESAAVREAQRTLHEELAALLDGDDPDPAAVGELVLALHDNRAAVKAVHDAAFEDFKALLTAEQLAKLEKLQEVRRHFGAPAIVEDDGEAV